MKVRYRKGIANHPDPESCGGAREGVVEALTGESAGQPLSREIKQSGAPTLLSEAEGNKVMTAKVRSLLYSAGS